MHTKGSVFLTNNDIITFPKIKDYLGHQKEINTPHIKNVYSLVPASFKAIFFYNEDIPPVLFKKSTFYEALNTDFV